MANPQAETETSQQRALDFDNETDNYVPAYQIFAEKCDKYKKYAEWMDDMFDEHVTTKIGAKLEGGEALRALGVGTGSGEMDCIQLAKLKSRFPRIYYRVVEPLEGQVSSFKALAESKAHELHGVTFDWRQQTLEEYETAGDMTRFHFISCVHSLYHVQDLHDALMYLYSLLEPEGVLLVILQSDETGIPRFRHLVKRVLKRHHPCDKSYADARNILDRQGISYTLHRHVTYANITQCFDESSVTGGLLLDFLLHVNRFRETASEDVRKEVLEILGRRECSERRGSHGIFLKMNNDAIVIKKQSSLSV